MMFTSGCNVMHKSIRILRSVRAFSSGTRLRAELTNSRRKVVRSYGGCGCRIVPDKSLLLGQNLQAVTNRPVIQRALTATNGVVHFATSFTTESPGSTINDDDNPKYTNIQPEESTKTGGARRTLDQVVYQLQANIRRRRRIHKADINQAVDLIEQGEAVNVYGSFLLNCCCDFLPDLQPSYRIKLSERIWGVIRKSKDYTATNFEALLQALARNEDGSNDPFKYLEEARSVGVKVTSTMYYLALLIFCQRGDMEAAVKILNEMKEDSAPVNERFFNVLILGHARAGDIKGAAEILEVMRTSKILPTSQTWTMLLQAYIEAGDEDKLRSTYLQMMDLRTIFLTETQFYTLLKAAGKQGKDQIFNIVTEWALASNVVRGFSIVNLAIHFVHSKKLKNALNLVILFSDELRGKREPLGAFLIKELQSANISSEVYVQMVTSLQSEDRNPFALNIAAESCLKHKKFDMAYKVYEAMRSMNIPVRPHYFLPPFLEEMDIRETPGPVQVLTQMQALDIKPDWEMLEDWIVPKLFVEGGSIMEVLKYIRETTGISYSSGLISVGITVALNEKQLQQAVEIVDSLKGRVTNPESVIQALWTYYYRSSSENVEKMEDGILRILKFVSENVAFDKRDYAGFFILKLVKAGRTKDTESVLKFAEETKIPLSSYVVEIMRNIMSVPSGLILDKELQTFNGNGWQTMNENDVTGLECHSQELESKGMNTRGIDRKLFLKYCQKGDLPKALKVKEAFEEEFGKLSAGMKSALMGAYIQQGLLQESLEIHQQLIDSNNGAEIDTFKLIDLATLLVRNGRIEEGIKLMEQECITRSINRPENLSRNSLRFLDALSKGLVGAATQLGNSNRSEDHIYRFTEIFLEKGILQPSNSALAPSIQDLIRRRKIDDAIQRSEYYAEKFRLSPSLQELTYEVLRNQDLLRRLLKCSIATKGVIEAKRLLALARSDSGDLDGAAAGFRELGSRLRFDSIIRQCEYYSSRNEIDKLLNLIKALQKTGRNYDCAHLYKIAGEGCRLKGDDAALQRVLSEMEEQDMYISSGWKKKNLKD